MPPKSSTQEAVHHGLANPPELADYRRRLFDIEELELSGEEYTTYWPYVSNVWCIEKRYKERHYYNCRYRRGQLISKTTRPKKLSNSRDGRQCDASIRVDFDRDSRIYRLRRVSGGHGHTHDIDAPDKLKKNNALRNRVNWLLSVVPGIKPAELLASLQGVQAAGVFKDGRSQLVDAGGRFLTTKDVAN